jgi:hypothetical protein
VPAPRRLERERDNAMKTAEQLAASIERYRSSFWDRRDAGRPPVGVATEANWLPITYLRSPFARERVEPQDVTENLALTEYEATGPGRAVLSDDFMPFAAAWRAVPWLEAICGCPVRFSPGSLAPAACVSHPSDLARLPFPASEAWLQRLRALTTGLVAAAPADCWVAPTILRGPSDVLNALRGTDFFLDLYDDPAALPAAAARINRVLIDVLEMHFALVPPKLGGYGTFYGYWSPGPSVVIQEDAMGLCHPRYYREMFAALNDEIVRRLGRYVFFHLHSTGYRHYRDVLAVPSLGGLELTVETNGPSLAVLEPVLREITERTRLILFVDGYLDELVPVLHRLPRDGLYVILPDRYIESDAAFGEFVRRAW